LRGIVAQSLLQRSDEQGRVPVVEVLINIPAVANLIREGKAFQISSTMQTGRAHGMITFDHSINDLIKTGQISKQDGYNFLERRFAGRKKLNYMAPQ